MPAAQHCYLVDQVWCRWDNASLHDELALVSCVPTVIKSCGGQRNPYNAAVRRWTMVATLRGQFIGHLLLHDPHDP